MEYLVDVIMPVYNHEKYIAQALESIVNQVTNFRYRIIPGEDCSTDNSRAIIQRFEAEYPDKMFPIYHPKNLGALGNGYHLLSVVQSKYVAICEGDDYWTDVHKLQRQIDFLEANPDFSMCFTNVNVIDELGWDKPLDEYFPKWEKDVFTMEDFISSFISVIPTPTMVFRNILPKPLPDYYLKTISADIFIHFMVADKGKVKYFPEKTAVYRNHSGGVTKTSEILAAGEDMRILLYEESNKFFNYKYDSLFKKQLLNMIRMRIIFGSKDKGFFFKVKNFSKNMPAYLKYSDKIDFKEITYFAGVLFFPSLLKLISKKNG